MRTATTINEDIKVVAKRNGLNGMRSIMKCRYLYLLALPGLIFMVLFNYVPMYGVILAFKKFTILGGISGSEWVGLRHFERLFVHPDFLRALKNTLEISLGKILITFPAPIILAMLINELRLRKFKSFVQGTLYLPHFLSWVIIAGLVYNVLSMTGGIWGKLLAQFNLDSVQILGNPQYFRSLVYVTSIWKGAGWGTIIYLASLAGIDPGLYESARIDGANRFQQALYITLPGLSFAIAVNLILSFGGVMNAGFDQIFNLYDPGVYQVGDILDTFVYRSGVLQAQYDFSTAVGLFKSLINLVLLITANSLSKRLGQDGLF